ncbi:hypothetical protein [Flexibacterium corallicola]|uniref:hypothetical protein n=1 Tax=Flexibacterium corallicola TaxID=3037259 RepID=UPI00286ED9B4|nr:hypothetical protein [Pseudovibrio sp. M1P-2-3]
MSYVAQANDLQDAGEVIPGAIKFNHGNILTPEKFAALDSYQQVALTTKKACWPEPDWSAMIKEGSDPHMVALQKVIYQKIPSKPVLGMNDDPVEFVSNYVKGIQLYRSLINEQTDMPSLKEHIDNYITSCWEQETESRRTSCLPADILALSAATRSGGKRVKGEFYARFQGRYKCTELDLFQAKSMVFAGWPNAEVAWKKNNLVVPHNDKFRIHFKKGRSLKYYIKEFDCERDAEHFLQIQYKKNNPDTPKKLKKNDPYGNLIVGSRPHLDKLERTGLNPVGGEKMRSSEGFVNEFNLRGVQFGKSVSLAERRKLLRLGSEALQDLCNIVDIPIAAIGQDQTFSVAFGARGRPGAAAHYEPVQKIINLTRFNGAGSVAHELAHFIDDVIMRKSLEADGHNQSKYNYLKYASGGSTPMDKDAINRYDGPGHSDRIDQAWKNVMQTIHYKQPDCDEYINQIDDQ